MPSTVHQALRSLLILHGLSNIAQGVYAIVDPHSYATMVPAFTSSSTQALQSIGLGCLGVGVYSFAGALSDSRQFYFTTSGLRIVFGAVVLTQWDLEQNWGVAVYELMVAVLAFVAASSRESGRGTQKRD